MTIGTLGSNLGASAPLSSIGIMLAVGVAFVICDQVARVFARHLRRKRDRADALQAMGEAQQAMAEAQRRVLLARSGIFDDGEGRN